MTGRILLLTVFTLLAPSSTARRGALVRDGMSSKIAYDNPLLGQSGDVTMDPDVSAITTKCANWCLDPICLDSVSLSSEEESICREALGNEVMKRPLYVTFKAKTLAGGKRPNWMRATAVLGEWMCHICQSLIHVDAKSHVLLFPYPIPISL